MQNLTRNISSVAQLLNSCLPTLCVGVLAFYPLGQPPSNVFFNICLVDLHICGLPCDILPDEGSCCCCLCGCLLCNFTWVLLFIEEINETPLKNFFLCSLFRRKLFVCRNQGCWRGFSLIYFLFTEQCALKSNKIKLNLSISTSDNILDKTLGSLTCDQRRTVCLYISDVLQMYFITFDPAA